MRLVAAVWAWFGGDISIHAPQWGATRRSGLKRSSYFNFNPRTPVGCDPPCVSTRPARWISIHAPQWGATQRDSKSATVIPISIHAPQWGATLIPRVRRAENGISIHAPQWGATVLGTSRFPWVSYFNPRTPVGCDPGDSFFFSCSRDFNPRTPVGCDLASPTTRGSNIEFQSTHPSGVRLKPQRIVRARPGFQSTHPSGVRRLRCPSELPTEPISIHAPQWGATLPQYWHGSVVIFQSTHPSGVRPPGRPVLTARSHFNPRTPVGCDRSCSFEYSFAVISIHAPQWGATGRKLRLLNMQSEFQSTHPSGVRRADDWADLLAEDFNPRTPVGCDPRC